MTEKASAVDKFFESCVFSLISAECRGILSPAAWLRPITLRSNAEQRSLPPVGRGDGEPCKASCCGHEQRDCFPARPTAVTDFPKGADMRKGQILAGLLTIAILAGAASAASTAGRGKAQAKDSNRQRLAARAPARQGSGPGQFWPRGFTGNTRQNMWGGPAGFRGRGRQGAGGPQGWRGAGRFGSMGRTMPAGPGGRGRSAVGPMRFSGRRQVGARGFQGARPFGSGARGSFQRGRGRGPGMGIGRGCPWGGSGRGFRCRWW